MYCQHFNLEKKPFQINSDNQFLWKGEKHAAALELLQQGVVQNQGLLVLTGDVGTGKTTLINEFIHTLDAKTQSFIIDDSSLEMHHIFLTIAQAFGFEDRYQKGKNFSAQFVSFLKTANAEGRKVIVIVDEAQRIPERFLKEIIAWSKFRLDHVLTVILAGQLEFQDLLRKQLGASWRNHIKLHAFLEPLDENETKIYINKRLEVAGSNRKIFLVSAIHEIHVYSKGFPRLINIACDQGLIAAFAKGVRLVDAPTIKQALGQIDLPVLPSGEKEVHPVETIPLKGAWFQKKALIGGIFLLICLFTGYLQYGENGVSAFKKQPDTIELPVPQVQEPEDQPIDSVYTPASSMEDKQNPSPIVINNFMETDQTTKNEKATAKEIDGFIKDVFLFKEKAGFVRSEGAMDMAKEEVNRLPGTVEPFEEPPIDDSPAVINKPDPDAIIDWLIHKREAQ